MEHHARKPVAICVIVFWALPLTMYPQSQNNYGCTSSILGHFNATAIPGGSSIWFTAVLTSSGTPTTTATVSVTQYMITFGQQATGVPFQCHNYPPVNTINFFSPPGEAQLTYFDSANFWKESVPLGLGGNTFLAGCTVPPCASGATFDCIPAGGLAGGLPVTWTMQFQSTTTQPIVWQWGAAVYSQFAPCVEAEECQGFGPLGIKAVDNQNPSLSCVDSSSNCLTFANSDSAGTPENFKQYVVAGATGNGGTNYTGTQSKAGSCTPVASPCVVATARGCHTGAEQSTAMRKPASRLQSTGDSSLGFTMNDRLSRDAFVAKSRP
jgi:hypothetical protein